MGRVQCFEQGGFGEGVETATHGLKSGFQMGIIHGILFRWVLPF